MDPPAVDPLDGLATTDDALLGGRVRLRQPAKGYRAAIDPLLLAASLAIRPGETLLDLCCGVGTVGACALARVPGITVVGVEIDPALAALARHNAAANGIADRYTVIEGDATARGLLDGRFHHVALNPPWHDATHPPSPDPRKARANSDHAALLPRLVDVAVRRLRPGGTLSIIHRVEAVPALLAALDRRVGALALRPIATAANTAPSRVILSAIEGRRTPFALLPVWEPAQWKPMLGGQD